MPPSIKIEDVDLDLRRIRVLSWNIDGLNGDSVIARTLSAAVVIARYAYAWLLVSLRKIITCMTLDVKIERHPVNIAF